MRILIADRDQQFLDFVQGYLWKRGYEVETASNELGCAFAQREFLPDVLLLERDLQRDGAERVLVQMSDDSELAGMPVLLISDHDKLEWID